MYEGHLLLYLPDAEVKRWEDQAKAWASDWGRRIVLGVVALVVGVAILFVSYLKLDAWTRGYYGLWLKTGAVASFAALVGALYVWIS